MSHCNTTKSNTTKNSTFYGNCLMVLLILFSFRVFAQIVQKIYPVTLLPSFETWHSDTLPYPLLLISQFIIIGLCTLTVWRFKTHRVKENQRIGIVSLVLGSIYLTVMVFRLIAGLSFAANHPWFGAHLPTLFHIVLALFLLVVGFYHTQHSQRICMRLIYPLIIFGALVAHYLSTVNNVNIFISTYIPILLSVALINYLEKKMPYRSQWLPNSKDIKQDASYMILVQLLLPRCIGFLIIILLANVIQNYDAAIATIWPHKLPVIFQALMMLLVADFLRYWLHRLSHRWKPLWKLHEIHHSPKKLYWMNVGRFHPLEKVLQYIFDALPFIILGVSQEVLALYFVFYAVNGFFQHCNIDLRLGFLNYLISGPELHRWHHSKRIHESDNNFGNNLIIWDVIFSTRYLPNNRSVSDLGVLDDHYPTSFSAQLVSPFIDKRKSQ